ncbi:uncharacterized protein LOC111731241 [Pteropus vampyrus]|uniref:Uncharacterized protein LOC111731241 n=1 Tax=Pteropus vampyrus TaxID=132908 RepID=A0A6P6BTT4_PTEVA|nr:uncharacterized protein LOC111731241 [Pteropus vampyrus]
MQSPDGPLQLSCSPASCVPETDSQAAAAHSAPTERAAPGVGVPEHDGEGPLGSLEHPGGWKTPEPTDLLRGPRGGPRSFLGRNSERLRGPGTARGNRPLISPPNSQLLCQLPASPSGPAPRRWTPLAPAPFAARSRSCCYLLMDTRDVRLEFTAQRKEELQAPGVRLPRSSAATLRSHSTLKLFARAACGRSFERPTPLARPRLTTTACLPTSLSRRSFSL